MNNKSKFKIKRKLPNNQYSFHLYDFYNAFISFYILDIIINGYFIVQKL